MRKGVLVLAPLSLLTLAIVACSAADRRSGFGDGTDAGSAEGGGGGGLIKGNEPCAGLECKIPTDCGGEKTTLRGKVYDPAGANPLYNVQVYIPGGNTPDQLPPIKDSVKEGSIACETCASTVLSPLKSALTDGTGEFVLEDVPVDKDVPVVIQVGKWRRLFKIDIDKKCEENTVDDRELRLPRNGDEGDMPQIAVTSGGYDALECLLRGIGIDDSEFVMGNDDSGHVHVFKGEGGGMGTPAEDFWNDEEQLKKYDMLLLSCEGDEYNGAKANKAAMHEYLNAGGKVFATHFHYTWFKNSPQDEFKTVASWGSDSSFPGSEYDVNTSFPKGEKFAEWLAATGASKTLGKIKLDEIRTSVKTVNDPPSQSWIHDPGDVAKAKYFSFNTPISSPAEEQCGRAVFSDLHVVDSTTAAPAGIGECALSSGGLNAQQKAIEFLFFDLSACVSDDAVEPQPPK